MSTKRHFIFILFIIFTTISSVYSAAYNWNSVIIGGGGFVSGIVYHPAVSGLIYARTDMGGAYRWDAASSKWTAITDFLDRNNSDYMGILSIAVDPNDVNRVYAMTGKYTASWAGNGALLSSTDRGATWTIIPLAIKVGGNDNGRGAGERLAVDPNLGSILFMGGGGNTGYGLWKSTNNGAAWAQVSTFNTTANVNFVIFDKSSAALGSATQRIFVGVLDTTGQSLFMSTNGGASWTAVNGQPTTLMALRADISNGFLYTTWSNNSGPNGATAGAVWKYQISNGTWTDISPVKNPAYGYGGISVDAQNPLHMIVSTLDLWWPMDQVWRSTDGGATWKYIIWNTSTNATIATFDNSYAPWAAARNIHWLADIKIDPFNSAKAQFVTGFGIYACDNLAAANTTWYFRNAVLEEMVPIEMVAPPTGPILLSAMGDQGGFIHTNLNVSPSTGVYKPDVGTTLSIDYAELLPTKIAKAFNAPSPFGAYSLDSGTTWINFGSTPAGASAGGSQAIALSANGTNYVWAPSGAALSYSSDNGGTWTTCGGGAPAGYCPESDRVNSNKFYYYDSVNGKLWASTTGGVTFTQSATAYPTLPSYQSYNGSVNSVFGREGDVWITTGAGGLWHSTDSGVSAVKLGTVTEAYAVGFGKAAGAYPAIYIDGIVGGVQGFFRSDDTGSTWTRINDASHMYGWVHCIRGDLNIYGRVYVALEGRGIVYGDVAAAGTPTFTPTYTYTNSATSTPTATYSQTASSTLTKTSTPTYTNTLPANTATYTPTFTITNTPSFTATGTATKTQTNTFSSTMTITMNPQTDTFTPTSTLTKTPTFTLTSTFTVSSTYTLTISPTFTSTGTNTASPTLTLYAGTPTDTYTVTPTPTETTCACGNYAGYGTIASFTGFDDSGVIDSNKISLKEAGTVTSLSINVSATGGGQIRMALYDDNSGAPGNLITESAPQPSAIGWNTVDITDTSLAAGNYWIAFQMEAGVTITADKGINGDEQWIAQSFGSFPAAAGAVNPFLAVYSLKANYCPAVCSTPTPIGICACQTEFGMTYQAATAGAPAGFAISSWYGMSEDGVASSMDLYVVSGSGQASMAIYSNSLTTTAAGQPYELVAQSDAFTVVTGWNTVNIPQTLLKANTIYWLTFQSGAGIKIAGEGGGTGDMYYRSMAFGAYPEKFTNATANTDDYSINVNYCPVLCPPTATPTPTNTASYTASPTITYTATATSSYTVTETQTIMINSPTITQTVTMTATGSATYTITQTQTISLQSPTNTPVQSATYTATYTFTSTFTGSATNTPTSTQTLTNTFTDTQTATFTQAVVNTLTITITLTPEAVATTQTIQVKDPLAYPNPYDPETGDSLNIGITLTRDARDITFKLYTTQARLIRKCEIGSAPAGIKVFVINSERFKELAKGVYYFTVEATGDNNTKNRSKIDKLIIIR